MADIAEFAPPREIRKDGTMTVAYGTDDGMVVEFFEEPMLMEYLSKQVGHPVYRNQIMTRILQPGNRTTTWVHATKGISYEMAIDSESGEYHTVWEVMDVCENGDPTEAIKYPKAWARFLRKGVTAESGHPVEEWGTITRSYAAALKGMHIHTVEALAQLTDQAAQNIMGGIKYRDLAKAYLDERKHTELLSREQERASRFEEMYKEQAAKLEGMMQTIATLQSRLAGGESQPPGIRAGEQQNIAPEMRKITRKNAAAKHQIPPPDTPQAA